MAFAQRLIATRRGAVVVSVIAAILAGILIVAYVHKYRSSVNSEGAPVTVLVAKQAIPKGTSGTVVAKTGLYSATTIRQSQLLRPGLLTLQPLSLHRMKGKSTSQVRERTNLASYDLPIGIHAA